MAGPQHEEKNMNLISKADLYKKSTRELAGMNEEIRKGIGTCEQQRRKGYTALQQIRSVQAQRRVLRPGF
jgi:hypothetical protein